MTNDKRAERRQKRRKSLAAGRPASYSQLYKDDNTVASSGSSESKMADGYDGSVNDAPGGRGSDSVDWQGEYQYVFRDLRTLLLISALIFVVMISVGYLL